ncbi:MAG: hypothetical protein NPIRA03_40130 [Nitrospirales bacterium]|nr:MAG: hypothetical protein NPIRA03_40130 [Nitrospirales bacterium]
MSLFFRTLALSFLHFRLHQNCTADILMLLDEVPSKKERLATYERLFHFPGLL